MIPQTTPLVAPVRPRPQFGVRRVPRTWRVAKRAVDVGIAGVALIATAPLVALAAAAIAVVSPGSPFFAQERVGEAGRRFRLYKLRTMVDGAHLKHSELHALNEVDGPVFKIRNDPRLHPLGKLLRRTSIDELPNLFNVLRGARRCRPRSNITTTWRAAG
jgi:lipopolysaccharide/colanic/teichoic acid biosynthesis glycosyltransferase